MILTGMSLKVSSPLGTPLMILIIYFVLLKINEKQSFLCH